MLQKMTIVCICINRDFAVFIVIVMLVERLMFSKEALMINNYYNNLMRIMKMTRTIKDYDVVFSR